MNIILNLFIAYIFICKIIMNKYMEKYPVYRNDIKYKKYKNIDPNKALWSDKDVEKDFYETNTDSLAYRIKLCKLEKYDNIDLSYLNQNDIDNFFLDSFFINNKDKIKHLFINDCKIYFLSDLNSMTSLETLDISNNELTELPNLPQSLTELVANNNKLNTVNNIDLPNIIRLDLSHNNLTKLPPFNSVQKLYINNNNISSMNCKYNNLKELNCSNNSIFQLPEMNNISILDCSNTKVRQIFDYMNLTDIVCNNSIITKLERIPRLEFLQIVDTKIEKLDYFHNLRVLIFNKYNNIKISSKYNVVDAICNKHNIMRINMS
jgi:Leucine-rich repeat (LRR) protein